MRTEQQLYDIIVAHLRKQHARSQNPSGSTCLYRSPDNLKCAVGALIPDEVYDPEMESSLHTLIYYKGNFLPEALRLEFSANFDLLERMQEIHDKTNVDDWEDAFKKVAKRFGLQYTPLETP